MKQIIFFLIILTFCPVQYIVAQPQNGDINKKINDIEKAIEEKKKNSRELKLKADNIKSDLSKAKNGRIVIANTVQKLEKKMSKLESEISDLNEAENEKRNLLNSRRGQFTNILMALQRISRLPPEAIVIYPAEIRNLIRTTILLRSAVFKIEIQASQLREDIIALTATRQLIAKRKFQLDKTGKEFRGKRIILDKLISLKARQHRRTISKRQAAASKIKSLSSKAKNLRDLFVNIEQERKNQKPRKLIPSRSKKLNNNKIARLTKPIDLKPFALSRGSLRYPAVGPISGRYGEVVQPGVTRKGITIKTRSSAQIVAPYNGRVVFAGNFRGYGQLLIIDHGEGYHTLLAGMSRIDGTMGQQLLSGEPIGVMGSVKKGLPSLYVELRRNSQPINPTPWLAQTKTE